MTLITLQDGKIVLRDGKVGTEQACCCGGGECDCDAFCDGNFELEIEGITITSFVGITPLCAGGSGQFQNSRQTAWNSAGCVDGKRRINVQVSTDCSFDRCTRATNFLYEFQECDESGCPSEDAVLIETTFPGVPPSQPCVDPECVDHECSTVTAPTAVRFNPLP